MSDESQPDTAQDQSTARGVDRRTAVKWVMAAMTASAFDWQFAEAQSPVATVSPARSTPRKLRGPRGTHTDPDLLNPVVPWQRQLTRPEMVTVTALCDTIIPADDHSPSASAVGVPAFINEWVSAPFPAQQADLARVRAGLAWLNAQATTRFGKRFAQLSARQKESICDDIADVKRASAERLEAAKFFATMRNLSASAFYTTTEGMKDIGYVGNVALPSFPGPPRAVLARLGLV